MPPPERDVSPVPAAGDAALLRAAARIPAQAGPESHTAAEMAAPVPRAAAVLAVQASAGNAAAARLLDGRDVPPPGVEAQPVPPAPVVAPVEAQGGGGLWGAIRRRAAAALDWARQHVLKPLTRMGTAAASSVTRFGAAALRGVASVRPRWGDLLVPQMLAFRAATAARQSVTSEVIADERRDRRAAASASGLAPDQDPGPGPVEQLDSAARRLESLAEGPMGVADELVEGAILGDFKEDPSGWNTVGQIAMGFVPYAGQVADARDTVAAIRALHRTGWRGGWEWANLGLTLIAWVPGVGDLVKGLGKGALRWLKGAAPALLRRGRQLWTAVRRALPRLLGRVRAFGGRLLSGARRLGSRALAGARNLGSRIAGAGRRLWSGAQGLLSRAGSTVGNLLGRARAAGSQMLSRGRALLGRAASAVRGLAQRAFGSASSVVRRALEHARAAQARVRQIAADIRRRAMERVNAARQWASGTLTSLRTHAGNLLRRAQVAGRAALQRATQAGRNLLRQGADRVRRFVAQGIPDLARRARDAVQQGARRLRDRVRNGLSRWWESLRDRFRRTPEPQSPKQLPGHGSDMPGGAANVNAGVQLRNQLRTAQAAGPLWESLRANGKLPSNYVTKAQAAAAGWQPGKALDNYLPGAQIGGDVFRNTTGVVPSAPGRVWYEADVGLVGNMSRAKQPGTRLLYSNDGLAYVTFDHYESVVQIPNWR